MLVAQDNPLAVKVQACHSPQAPWAQVNHTQWSAAACSDVPCPHKGRADRVEEGGLRAHVRLQWAASALQNAAAHCCQVLNRGEHIHWGAPGVTDVSPAWAVVVTAVKEGREDILTEDCIHVGGQQQGGGGGGRGREGGGGMQQAGCWRHCRETPHSAPQHTSQACKKATPCPCTCSSGAPASPAGPPWVLLQPDL